MSQNLNIQAASNVRHCESKGRKILVASVLWTIQVLLALVFLFAGSMKLIMPIEAMTAQMSVPLPGLFLRFIGVAEVAGALGLILPGLVRIQKRLTPVAACGLIIIMVGAVVVTLISGGIAGAIVPLVVGLLCVQVAYARRSWAMSYRRNHAA
jgi:uncharacterized membrane protein YphA (DoxX/SURF4 family)